MFVRLNYYPVGSPGDLKNTITDGISFARSAKVYQLHLWLPPFMNDIVSGRLTTIKLLPPATNRNESYRIRSINHD